jgi:hypothetical protein
MCTKANGGLAQILRYSYAPADGKVISSLPPDPLWRRAFVPVRELARACSRRDLGQVTQIGRNLIGLGPGLTPSGDDFMGGLLFAAHALKRAYPEEFSWNEEPVREFVDWARLQTNSISHTMLGDLAFGHGPEPLHDLLAALLAGKDVDAIPPVINRVSGIGHTSGWDLLAGFLTGMVSASENMNNTTTKFKIPCPPFSKEGLGMEVL